MERINPAGCSLGRLVREVVRLETKANSLRQTAARPDADLKTLASSFQYTDGFRNEAQAVCEDLDKVYAELDKREKQYKKA